MDDLLFLGKFTSQQLPFLKVLLIARLEFLSLKKLSNIETDSRRVLGANQSRINSTRILHSKRPGIQVACCGIDGHSDLPVLRVAMSLVEDDSKALAIVRWAICNLQERWPKLARCRLTEQLCRHV